MRTVIIGASIVNEGRLFKGSVIIEDEFITDVLEDTPLVMDNDNVVDAEFEEVKDDHK